MMPTLWFIRSVKDYICSYNKQGTQMSKCWMSNTNAAECEKNLFSNALNAFVSFLDLPVCQ